MTDYKDPKERCLLYAAAIAKYGQEAQLRCMQEECAELIAAINRFLRGRTGTGPVEEEIADVEIMTEQMYLIFNLENVKKIKGGKLERLAKNLEEMN